MVNTRIKPTTARGVVASVATAALLAVLATVASAHDDLSDVPDEGTHSAAIHTLDSWGVFEGTLCGEGLFCPDEPLSRAHMAVWTVRVLEGHDPGPVTETRFGDVNGDHPQAAFIERFAELEVTKGCGDGTNFCPDRVVSRAQMAVFLSRALDLDDGPDPGFSDVPEDAWYGDHVARLAASGITKGCGDGTVFCPEQDTTRAQMASFLYRADEHIRAQDADVEPTLHPPDVYPWEPPHAGLVPQPYPLCDDSPSTWDGSCLPPSEWHSGEVDPRNPPDETPRQTPLVVEFTAACRNGGSYYYAFCDRILSYMKWPLDYLGADPVCIQAEYANRVLAFVADPSSWGAADAEANGWHRCATVIDPLVGDAPDGRVNDVGYRLSDTGISLAERCRMVLPHDIQLETRYKQSGTPPTYFEYGQAGCDAWADYVESRIPGNAWATQPTCYRSMKLAEEWMEHYHSVPIRYWTPGC